ncbi:hypothetical protein WK62_05400 [Burkholderia ubonensis]|uniref:hypothetical protein n=1 Tax=Burkholderia ubonensis TaxID=101571 RepID=UPI00075606F5|nr:hypothetical protein [Burkholderia ubonensis]KVU10698.1 hypothetical protein WK62_05400 [Burkholderia ubonensis]
MAEIDVKKLREWAMRCSGYCMMEIMPRYILSICDRLEAAEKALSQIAEIEDKMFGGDWDEIEEARRIANAALAQRQGEGS